MFYTVLCFYFLSLLHQGLTLPSGNDESSDASTYKAAVIEMIPFFNPQIAPLENERENIRIMALYAFQAKKAGADIIVFPEEVLTSRAPTDRLRFLEYSLAIPDPIIDKMMGYRCRKNIGYRPLNEMRCAAKALEMYMVFNVPEKVSCRYSEDPNCNDDQYYIYNTNIVLDRNGTIVAKYRKEHITGQHQYDKGDNEAFNRTFTTDFGVLFSQFIGIDIIYEQINDTQHQGAVNFVMPSNWVDTLPFYTAPQVQYSWSRGLGVNLLAAGIHEPGVGAAGSGIYTGASNILNSIYIYNTTESKVLVKDIITSNNRTSEDNTQMDNGSQEEISDTLPVRDLSARGPFANHLFLSEPMEEKMQIANNPIVVTGAGDIEGTYNPSNSTDSFKYYISYDYRDKHLASGAFYFVFYSGISGISSCMQANQVAALVFCPELEESCGKRPIPKSSHATFQKLNLTVISTVPDVFPSVINQDFQLIGEDKWSFTKTNLGDKTSVSIYFNKPIEDIYAVTMLGRRYDKDPEC